MGAHRKPLTAKEAVEQWHSEASNAAVLLTDFRRAINLTDKELLAELQAGRLVAVAVHDGNDETATVFITFDAMRRWFDHPQTPPRRLRKAIEGLRTLNARSRPN